jgi:predicted PurR-regulated permease PerM
LANQRIALVDQVVDGYHERLSNTQARFRWQDQSVDGSEAVLGLDRRAASYTWTVVLILLLLRVVYLIREILFIFVVALLFAYLLWPLIKLLDRWLPGRSKALALSIVYLSLIGLLIVIGIAIGSRVVLEANALATRAPELLSRLEQPAEGIAGPSIQTVKVTVVSTLRKQLVDHSRDILSLLPNAALGVLSHAGSLMFIVLVPILSFFFLKDGRVIRSSVMGILAEGSRRDMITEIAADLHLLLAQYMRALVLLAAAAFLAYGVFFFLLGVPFGILLAAIAFPLEFIPMVGPLAGSAIIMLVAGLSGFHHLFWILGFLAAFRVFQDYVLSPRLLSAGMELHPLVIIFGVLAGGYLAGIAGSFLSVPVLATLRIVYRQLQKEPVDSRLRSPRTGMA